MTRPAPFPTARVAASLSLLSLVAFGAFAWSVLPGLHAQIAALKREKLVLQESVERCHLEFDEYEAEYQGPCCDDYRDLLSDHRELYDLHHEFMQWGPLRTPRDCVRETILMEWKIPLDESLWPTDVDAQLAHCLGNLKWCQGERLTLVEAMDAGRCGSGDRWAMPHRPGDDDSMWIYPPGYVPPQAALPSAPATAL